MAHLYFGPVGVRSNGLKLKPGLAVLLFPCMWHLHLRAAGVPVAVRAETRSRRGGSKPLVQAAGGCKAIHVAGERQGHGTVDETAGEPEAGRDVECSLASQGDDEEAHDEGP